MDPEIKFPTLSGTPLFHISAERVNQQRLQHDPDSPSGSLYGSKHHSRESSVHEKVAAFNSLAFQGKQLERKTNDAALKRAMLGREEAESEMRRYKEDVKALRRQIEEGKERERKVGERLESVMVFILLSHWFTHCLCFCRKTTAELKRPTRIHKHYGRRRSEGHARSHSNHNRS